MNLILRRKIKIRIAFRVDASSDIGFGHLMRTMALANGFPSDVDIIFITKDFSEVIKMLKNKQFDIIEIPNNNEYKKEIELVKEIIEENNIDILVTDSYDIDQKYLTEIKKVVDRLVSIHDYAPFAFPSDIVINGNIYAPELDYKSLYGDTEFLLGTDYTLMREEFQGLPDKEINEEVENILVTVGGSDILNLTPKIIKAINRLDKEGLTIDVVIGAGFDNMPAIIKEVERSIHEIRLHFNVNRMSELMIDSDMAISAGGSTLYELAAAGVPAIVMLQAENQKLVTEAMADESCIVNLGFGDEIYCDDLTDETEGLIGDFGARKMMSKVGQRLVDGKGVVRVSKNI